MTPEIVLDIGREAIEVLLITIAPIMATALVIGLIISLFQALTQIQEMTLSFAPKIVAVFLVTIIALPFMIENLQTFAEHLFEKIASQPGDF